MEMTDRLYLSLWLRDFATLNLPRHFTTLLKTFPFSRLRPAGVLTVRAVALQEAPLEEEALSAIDPGAIAETLEHWLSADAGYELEAAWDLLAPDGNDWRLRPVTVRLLAFGPDFDSGSDEQLRIEFGTEALFLPATEAPGSYRMAEANIRSLLQLMKDLEKALPIARRHLWSESGEDLAARLAALIAGGSPFASGRATPEGASEA